MRLTTITYDRRCRLRDLSSALSDHCCRSSIVLCDKGSFLRKISRILVRGFDIDDVLLKSITGLENFLPSPSSQRPPFDFVHERDSRRRSAADRAILELVPLMRSLIFSETRVLIVVETFPLIRHILLLPIDQPSFKPHALAFNSRWRRLGKR